MPSDSKPPHPRPPGHVLVPAATIGALSLMLAVGLHALGILNRLNEVITKCLSEGKDLPKSLPQWVIWLAAIWCAFGVSFGILSVAGTWRRLVLWTTTIVLVIGWGPVLTLAARNPDIAAVLIATGWSGVCALVYAGRHQMACDNVSNPLFDETR
ncbi:MAG: hypothetical protein ABI600_21105 [Luteolibacter sp.]